MINPLKTALKNGHHIVYCSNKLNGSSIDLMLGEKHIRKLKRSEFEEFKQTVELTCETESIGGYELKEWRLKQ